MMYGKVTIGEKEVMFCTAASVNVCYANVFHKDFIKTLSSDEDLATSTMTEMAFIMAKFAEKTDRKAVNRLTQDDYCDWLDQFTVGDLTQALPEIQALYMSSTKSAVDAKKNTEPPSEK